MGQTSLLWSHLASFWPMKSLLIKSEEPSDMDVNSGICVCGTMISMQKSHTK